MTLLRPLFRRSRSTTLPVALLLAVTLCSSAAAAPVEHHDVPEGAVQVETVPHPEGPIEFKVDLALWSLVAFLVVLLILGKFAWNPLSSGLHKREQGIRDDIAAAETARRKAEAMLAEHEGRLEAVQEEVRGILAEARRDAEVVRQNILSDAQREAEATQRRAVEEIRMAKDTALQEIFTQLNQRVMAATEHVLGRAVNDHDQDRLIEEALAELRRQSS